MCWSIEVSFMTGLFTYVVSYYIYKRNIGYDRWISLLLLAVGTIQWLEVLIWYDMTSEMNSYITTYAIPLALTAQYLLALYGASLYTEVDKRLVVIYIAIGIAYILYTFASARHSTVKIADGLAWGDEANVLSGILFAILLALPFVLYMKDKILMILVLIAGAGTLAFSLSRHPYNWKSYWCLYGNILSIFILLRPII